MDAFQLVGAHGGAHIVRYFTTAAAAQAFIDQMGDHFHTYGLYSGAITRNADGMLCWMQQGSDRLEAIA